MKALLFLIIISLSGVPLAFSQPMVKVWGTEDSLALKQQVVRYLEYLEIRESINVSVGFTRRMPEKLVGTTYPQLAPASDSIQIIKVRIDSRLPEKKRDLVLAHEMIHVKQYATGELRIISKKWVLWKGKKRLYNQVKPYAHPWEREAYRYDRRIVAACDTPLEEPFTVRIGQ